jgi:hypothetical protein
MPTLAEQINTPQKRPAVVADLAKLVDQEVSRKGGLAGIGIKTAYGLLKAIKPTFVPEVIDGMFDEFVARLEPIYAECRGEGAGALRPRLEARSSRVADALLSVTDGRAERTTHGSAKKAYLKLRPAAKRNVEEAVPGLGTLLDRHAKD